MNIPHASEIKAKQRIGYKLLYEKHKLWFEELLPCLVAKITEMAKAGLGYCKYTYSKNKNDVEIDQQTIDTLIFMFKDKGYKVDVVDFENEIDIYICWN